MTTVAGPIEAPGGPHACPDCDVRWDATGAGSRLCWHCDQPGVPLTEQAAAQDQPS